MEKEKKANAAKPTYEELEQQVKHLTKSLSGAKGANATLRGMLQDERRKYDSMSEENASMLATYKKSISVLKEENSRLLRAVEANEAALKKLRERVAELKETIERKKPWWKKLF